MANENIIAYQNRIKANNLARIDELNITITTIDNQIANMNLSITDIDIQKTNCQTSITDLNNDNILIDQNIAILSQ